MRLHTVAEFMTPAPLTIAAERTLADAHQLMRQARIRHLPVFARGRLVGIVSRSDLHLVETLKDVDPREVTVGEAMSKDPYTASTSARLATVAQRMASRRIGATVVTQRGRPVGVFTTVDALRALASLATPGPRAGRRRARR
jgi:acetoin utilization protein AcuB